MSKVISFSLSKDSISKAAKELRAYSKWLMQKNAELTEALANMGIPVIDEKMSGAAFTYDGDGVESGSDTMHDTVVNMTTTGSKSEAVLILHGEKVAFIEFGAGVYYNGPAGSSPHPKGSELGMLIGTYGYGNGQKQIWGYRSASGTVVKTHGTKATMPVYSASMKIISDYMETVKKVFSDE